jgi:hypothetical protein
MRPVFCERQHHTIDNKCDEDWVQFTGSGHTIIETRAPFDLSDPSRYADTQIELYRLNNAGDLEFIVRDDDGGTGFFSKIDIVLPTLSNTYFARIINVNKPVNATLHYLIGVFNNYALWGNGGTGGNDGNGGLGISVQGGINVTGALGTVCPGSYITLNCPDNNSLISVTWASNVPEISIAPISQFEAYVSGSYSGIINITATINYNGNFVGSISSSYWYGLPPRSTVTEIVTPRTPLYYLGIPHCLS